MKFETNKALYILVTANLFVFVVWIVLLSQISGLRAKYKSVSLPLAEESGKESYVTKVNHALRDTEGERAGLAPLIIDKGHEELFLEKIEGLGLISATSLKISSFEQVPAGLHLNVISTGKFTNVYYFMSLLEALPLGVTVDRISLSEEIDEAKGIRWAGVFDVTLHNYYSEAK